MILPDPWSGPFSLPDTTSITGLPLASGIKNMFREKRWCYAGIVSPDLFFGAAVVHLGYAASGFCFGFDRKSKEMLEYTQVSLPINHVRYDRHPESGTCRFNSGKNNIEISGDLSQVKQLNISLIKDGQPLKAAIDFYAPDTGFSPMHFPMDMGLERTAFTTKAAGLEARGEILLGDKNFRLTPDNTFALFDWTHGAYPRQTFWNWACGAGSGEDKMGKQAKVGFNFSKGVYENGRLENTVWINGVPEPAGEIDYVYDPKKPLSPWQIQSKDMKIKLTFNPEGIRQANDNFIVLASRFIQPCGQFEGKITTASGNTYTLESTSGVVEEHYAKW